MNKNIWLALAACSFTFTSGFCATHKITQIPTSGIVINTPGTYVFENNITWTPGGDGQAILITANDVTLDLQKHTLTSTTTQFNTTGIMATAVKNLTVKNGTIANMALGGIQCSESVNIMVKHITVDGLNRENVITYTVPTGILMNLSKNIIIKKCTVKNMNVKTASSAAIQLTASVASKVLQCRVKNLLNRDGACTGIGHLNCDNALVDCCTIDNVESQFIDNLNTLGHTAIGCIPVNSSNVLISNCTVTNITGCCDDAHGMSLFECLNSTIKNCKVENVLDGKGAAQTGAKATGIEVYAAGSRVIDCSVKNIKAINPQDKQATGFSCAKGADVSFIGCKAENVQVVDQNGNQSPSLGYGTGFGWAPDPRSIFIAPAVGIFYKNCTAKKCQVGFDSWFHINSVWKDIYSISNGIAVLDQNNSQRTISCNACSECIIPITATITNVAKNNRFFHVRTQYPKSVPECTKVKKNKIKN